MEKQRTALKVKESIERNKRYNGRRKSILAVISLFVCILVFWQLTVPVITKTKLHCGLKEHIHSEENGCYNKIKVCSNKNHVDKKDHTRKCYTYQLECEKNEHTHVEKCYKRKTMRTFAERDITNTFITEATIDHIPVSGYYNATDIVQVDYSSDTSTSGIEKRFYDENGQLSNSNQGRIEVDKSVVYGQHTCDSISKIDHEAFDSYDQGEFSVTLSAMEQAYVKQGEEKTPWDVVFILDTSGSMETDDRMVEMTEALNETCNQLIGMDNDTRIGIVSYASTGAEVLALDRYSSINMSSTSTSATGTAVTTSGTSRSISYNATGGTYMQYGWRLAYEMLEEDNEDKSGRLPMVIFMTDGEPTRVTTDWDNPTTSNMTLLYQDTYMRYGLAGYYSILSAKHYSDLIDGLYVNNEARVYTIGLMTGNESCQANACQCYRHTILNPTSNNIKSLVEHDHTNPARPSGTTTTYMEQISSSMYYYLNKGYDENGVRQVADGATVTAAVNGNSRYSLQYNVDDTYWSEDFSGFSYSDGLFVMADAEFADQLKQDFAKMFDSYFISDDALDEELGHIEFTDVIGEGMEFKENTMVIRYNQVNYSATGVKSGNTTTFTFPSIEVYKNDANHALGQGNLKDIILTVTEENGIQTVHYDVPIELIPSHMYGEVSGSWYEAEPIQLIYKVGLKEGALDAAKTGDVFYTNQWPGTSNLTNTYGTTIAEFQPASDNPYYKAVGTGGIVLNTAAKKDSTTDTSDYFNETYYTGSSSMYSVYLGNNGKLVVDKDINVEVEKIWQDAGGSDIAYTDTEGYPNVTFELYATAEDTAVNGILLQERVVSYDNSWKHKWNNEDLVVLLTAVGMASVEPADYKYYVVEKGVVDSLYETYFTARGGDLTEGATSTPVVKGEIKFINRKSTIDLTVQKSWEDANGVTITYADAIEVALYRQKTGTEKTEFDRVEISADTNWEHTWEQLPARDASGNEYVYSIEEMTALDGFNVVYKSNEVSASNGKNRIEIVNTADPVLLTETGTLNVEKQWKDKQGNLIDGDKEVVLNLFRHTLFVPDVSYDINVEIVDSSDNDTLFTDTVTVEAGQDLTLTASGGLGRISRYGGSGTAPTINSCTVDTADAATVQNSLSVGRSTSGYYYVYTLGGSVKLTDITGSATVTVLVDNMPTSGTINPSFTSAVSDSGNAVKIESEWKCVEEGVHITEMTTTPLGQAVLNPDNEYKYTWNSLTMYEDVIGGRNYYYYYVDEIEVTNYDTTYSISQLDKDGNPSGFNGANGTIMVTNTATKTWGYILPATGGSGTKWFTIIGISLMAFAVVLGGMLLINKKRNKKSSKNIS